MTFLSAEFGLRGAGLPWLLAMGAPSARVLSAWVQLLPFVLVVGIFYFVILLPMKRRQQKVQAFLAALKVGDRVVTSGGLVRNHYPRFRSSHPGPDRRQGAG